MIWAAGLMMALAVGTADKASPAFMLGGQIADAARVAEKTLDPGGDAIQGAVMTAAQRVITISGQKPQVVQTALETVLNECPLNPRAGQPRDYLCPTTNEAHAAIERLLVVVRRLAALEQAPGAGYGDGIGALGAPPVGGGGSDYRSTLGR